MSPQANFVCSASVDSCLYVWHIGSGLTSHIRVNLDAIGWSESEWKWSILCIDQGDIGCAPHEDRSDSNEQDTAFYATWNSPQIHKHVDAIKQKATLLMGQIKFLNIFCMRTQKVTKLNSWNKMHAFGKWTKNEKQESSLGKQFMHERTKLRPSGEMIDLWLSHPSYLFIPELIEPDIDEQEQKKETGKKKEQWSSHRFANDLERQSEEKFAIVATSQSHVYFSNELVSQHNYQQFAQSKHWSCLSNLFSDLHFTFNVVSNDRLQFVKFIKGGSFSMLVVGSPGYPVVALFHVFYDADEKVHVKKCGFHPQLYCNNNTHDGNNKWTFEKKLTLMGMDVIPVRTDVDDTIVCWKVLLLYENGRLWCLNIMPGHSPFLLTEECIV
ncbi:hypothetical protein RFI_13474 [Reticulomyxa filosa]|uniref:Uncharacterized protein n=1 Tax=Reticulomyxa filosa TaxID=46433 RepID=X6NCT4_RETFI|nr:hypothetical protein RFI_13474 [Reticulomyxa filosa]|eukprot:ETO23708.1 hypothetical protein RFI_13474 [Reticulomyxa filosa]